LYADLEVIEIRLRLSKGRMFVADGGKSVEALLAMTGEPYRPEMQMYADATELGVYDMWKLQLERSELQRQFGAMDVD
jgi:amidase